MNLALPLCAEHSAYDLLTCWYETVEGEPGWLFHINDITGRAMIKQLGSHVWIPLQSPAWHFWTLLDLTHRPCWALWRSPHAIHAVLPSFYLWHYSHDKMNRLVFMQAGQRSYTEWSAAWVWGLPSFCHKMTTITFMITRIILQPLWT